MIHGINLKHNITSWKTKLFQPLGRPQSLIHPVTTREHVVITTCTLLGGQVQETQGSAFNCTGAKDMKLAQHDWLSVEGHDLKKKLGNSFSRSKRNRDTHKSFFILDGDRKINGLNFLLELMFFWTPTT